jgi:diguanylate cyclase (GGDEF)-like protein/PAS domain S-box-containing protein
MPASDKINTSSRLRKRILGLAIVWSILIAFFFTLDYIQTYKGIIDEVRATAVESFSKDVLYRRWASMHGGVYVPVTEQTPPNPYLIDVPERDISTPSGKKLTLVNPAYMTRQVQEFGNLDFGSKGHITSLKPIRPENAPDDWERRSLQSFDLGEKEVWSVEQLGSDTYFRFMRPLIAEAPCLKCHEKQGYKVGDVRGGLSISIPWTPYREAQRIAMLTHAFAFVAIWLIGMFGLRLGKNRLKQYLFERGQAEMAMKESEESYRTLVEWSPEPIAVHRDGKLLYVNPAATAMFGAKSDQELVGKPILELVHPEFRQIVVARVKEQGEKGIAVPMIEEKFLKIDGTPIDVEVQSRVVHYRGSPAFQVVMRDITSQKAAQERIQTLAFYDPLTELPNRRLLLDRLQQALAGSVRQQRQGALMMVDLDNFKDINDVLGHEQGDLVLQQVGKRLSACVGERDTVARLGADEFVVLLAQLDQSSLEAAMQAEVAGHKILDALKQPYQFNGFEMSCTASIGITLIGELQDDNIEALKRAEMAMYQAKAHGRNTLRFFDPKMQATVNSRVAMEASLREAVGKNQLLLHYQPQVTDQGKITGVEALLRWIDPKRGMVSPAEFIPMAEDTGLILPIGNWVLDTACKQLVQWSSHPRMAHLTVAVNVSARQFHQRDFVDQVLMTLERTGANPNRLKLELTESVLVEDVEGVIAKMNALKARGVTFSLDDFGTGYSSLSYLQRLPLDQLKIDQGFVRDILINPNDAAIAKMVVALADTLGLTVIPEGVETEAQRDFLLGLGCHNFQGYLFSRPVPIEEFEALAARV